MNRILSGASYQVPVLSRSMVIRPLLILPHRLDDERPTSPLPKLRSQDHTQIYWRNLRRRQTTRLQQMRYLVQEGDC